MEEKWRWMMEWCKSNRVAPANPIFWKKAEEEYNKMKSLEVESDKRVDM